MKAVLQSLYESLPEERRQLQFGVETAHPLSEAFPQKRVVHAGMRGSIVPPHESQLLWQQLMDRQVVKKELQTAYIHIPFCKTKCLYCGFFQNGMNQVVEDLYIDCLVEEMKQTASSRRMKDSLIHAVFIGGGTPTSLSAYNAKRLLQAITTYLPLANDYELTLEGRIHDVVPKNIETWLSSGVNRISLGVQSFHTDVRRGVGRLDDGDTVLQRLQDLQAYTQCVVVIDLMYGLPGQTMDVWMDDIRNLVESGVDGADLYQLNVFYDSPLFKAVQNGVVSPPATTAEQALMFQSAKWFLDQRGYRRLNMCHWSRSNRERSLYNTLARSNAPMIPFGASAGGHIDGFEMMLYRSIPAYEMAIKNGQKPFMALMKQPVYQNLIDIVQYQLEQGYLDISKLTAIDKKMEELAWLYDFWQYRGLTAYNGYMYVLTEAGQFWQVNLAQTTLECIEYIVTGNTTAVMEHVAGQDSPKSPAMAMAMHHMKEHGGTANVEAMKKMAEMMAQMSPNELNTIMK